ncbi:hypothetical protein [Microcoleus sp. B4-D4]|uniref:hypothetical protein n=1 Tax=Microcoleus sp. B4-D4 TaxID=2818667 RepID=UPI002FD04A3A
MTCQGKTGFLVSGQLAVGGWQLEVGSWRLAVGGWRLAVACFPACCRLTTADSYEIRVLDTLDEPVGAGRLCLTFWRFQPPNHLTNNH